MQLIFPTAGSARILGRPVGDVAVRRRLGFLPENPTFYDYLTAEELLDYFASLFDVPAAERRARVAAVLDDVGLGKERRMHLRSYSKGMIQRVGIAQAIINEPEIVFLDEPMSGLDPLGRRDVRAAHAAAARPRLHGVLQLAHPVGRRERCAARWRSSRRAGWRPAAGCRRSSAFDVRGWELVLDAVSPALLAWLRARARGVTALNDGRYAVESAARRRPKPLLAHLASDGARVSCRSTRYATPSRTTSCRTSRRPPARETRRPMSLGAIRKVAGAVFKESVRDRVPYSLVIFAVMLMAASFLMSRLTAGQDLKVIKDLGPGDDERHRPAHRHLHRHRPGVEGGRAAEHLRGAVQAAVAVELPRRQVRRPRAHPGGEPGDDDRRLLR